MTILETGWQAETSSRLTPIHPQAEILPRSKSTLLATHADQVSVSPSLYDPQLPHDPARHQGAFNLPMCLSRSQNQPPLKC